MFWPTLRSCLVFFRLTGLPADCMMSVNQNFAPMETGLLQNRTTISVSEIKTNKKFLRVTKTFEEVSWLWFYFWICSQLQTLVLQPGWFSLEGVVHSNLLCYCLLNVLMTVQVLNMWCAFFFFSFFPHRICKSCRGKSFYFLRLTLPLQHGKNAVLWLHCFCLEFNEER